MISHEDQMDLFKLISKQIGRNIECYAFGGTAMMFYGYKDETKDIDLLFEKESEREEFIRVLKSFGYIKKSPFKIYIPEKLREKNIPLMYTRDENRFDIFVKRIFKTLLSPKMKEDLYAVHDFKDRYNLRIKVLRKEHIVILKAVTDRKNDFDDIKTIVTKEKNFDWQYLIDEIIWQYKHGDTWVLLDVERVIKELKQYTFIEQKYLKQIYNAYGKEKHK